LLATPLLPAADGGSWLLVAGRWIAEHHDALDVAAMSAAFGREVQLFVTHRVVELHRWERARDGATIRSFEYLGEAGAVRRWSGAPDDVELAIGLPSVFDLGRDDTAGPWLISVDEPDVMRVASAWSVDPSSLDGQPATDRLSLVRLPISAGGLSVPDSLAVAVDVTDIFDSDEPHEEKAKKLASRLRRAGWDGADH
jgi:hypothetical protein